MHKEDIGYSEQIPHFTGETLLDEMTGGNVEEFQAKKILFGLGFTESELTKNPNRFSGGETGKISLAKALLDEPRVLILDEPTNHLDIYAIDFLEDFVKNYRYTVIAVTHDRHFLQNCVTKILDMENGGATLYPGNYEKYFQLKKERREYELKAYEKQQEEIAKLENFVQRNKVRASTAKRARSRQKVLDKMERLEKPPTEESVKLNLGDAGEYANRVLTLDEINFKDVIKNFGLEIFKGEKVGLIGKNGIGKSTLLKIIVGELPPDSGEIKIGSRVKIGYLSQGHEELDENSTAIDELVNCFGLTIERARKELARLDLGAEIVEKKIAGMSGGEKTRIAFDRREFFNPRRADEPFGFAGKRGDRGRAEKFRRHDFTCHARQIFFGIGDDESNRNARRKNSGSQTGKNFQAGTKKRAGEKKFQVGENRRTNFEIGSANKNGGNGIENVGAGNKFRRRPEKTFRTGDGARKQIERD